MPEKWPRLSQQLAGPRQIGKCQSCGCDAGPDRLIRIWQEHDDNDKPEPIGVSLCQVCSDRLIDPHPRLYRLVDPWEPFPGVMETCAACRHQQAMRCLNPLLKANGGPGLPLKFPQPTTIHIDGRDPKTGKRWGRWENRWNGPVTCEKREETKPEAAGGQNA